MPPYGPPAWLNYITAGLRCFILLAGLVAGIIAIAKKRILPGSLATAAFGLLGLNALLTLILSYIIFPIVTKSNGDYNMYSWANYCLNTPLYILGILALVILAFTHTGKKMETTISEQKPPSA